ncbi:MAG: M20/M25/M40 family metallo-hydrolase [Actinomycetota bacterium]|nr:M20/M25/M40 family metallo-hydrolase [Actinomycetota bacterium]
MITRSSSGRIIGRGAALVVLVALAAVSAGWVARSEGSDQKGSTRAEVVAQLPRSLSRARLRADLVALERIADRAGGNRAAGTTGYRASVAHVRKELERAGYTPRVLGFPFVLYRERVERGMQIAPTRRDLRIEALDYSPSTPKGGLRARVVAADDGCEPGDFDGVRGFIALARRGTCFFAVKARNAANSGAIALLVFNAEPGLFDGTLGDPQASPIPVAGIDGAVGPELASASGSIVELELETSRQRSTSKNVIADTQPGARSVLLVGAHLDSVLVGPGINDNATGVAALLEIARVARRRYPDLSVRFAFWGAEELGLFGSSAYAKGADRSRIVGYLNFDVLGSPSRERTVYKGGPFAARWLGYFERRGLRATQIHIGGRSDHFPFERIGIPTGGLFAGDYACYHRACDRLESIDLAVFDQLARAAAFGVASFAPIER